MAQATPFLKFSFFLTVLNCHIGIHRIFKCSVELDTLMCAGTIYNKRGHECKRGQGCCGRESLEERK